MVSNRLFGLPFGMVDVFVFGGWDVVEVPVEALRVEPVHPRQGGEFNVGDGVPRPLFGPVDQLGFVQAVDTFCQGVIGLFAMKCGVL